MSLFLITSPYGDTRLTDGLTNDDKTLAADGELEIYRLEGTPKVEHLELGPDLNETYNELVVEQVKDSIPDTEPREDDDDDGSGDVSGTNDAGEVS